MSKKNKKQEDNNEFKFNWISVLIIVIVFFILFFIIKNGLPPQKDHYPSKPPFFSR